MSDSLRRTREAALALLARREHSRAELQRKLDSRGHERGEVEEVLDALAQSGLLSEARFAESFVAGRVRRGQGPRRIRAELARRGLGDAAIEQALAEVAVEWQQLAASVRERRFGVDPPADIRARAKQVRFLEYRGFDAEHIYAVVPDCAPPEPPA